MALAAGAALLSAPGPGRNNQEVNVPATKTLTLPFEKVVKTDAEWRKQLTPEQFRVTRQAGTEGAGTGELLDNKAAGTYACACCGLPLFTSKAKYDSHCGWPSFYEPIAPENVEESDDGAREVHCARCDGHLGHVFTDGPKPTGLRY